MDGLPNASHSAAAPAGFAAASAGSGHPLPGAAKPAYPSLFKNRNFLLLWLAYVISALGDRIHFVIMLTLLMGMKGSHAAPAQDTAQLNVMMLLPFLVLGPFTGALADRLPRRLLMVTADFTRVAVVIVARTLFLAVPPALQQEVPWWPGVSYAVLMLLASELLLGAFSAVFSPARNALMPNLVHPDQLLRANSMTNSAGTIASLIGFVVGGYLVDHLRHLALYVDAGTFLCSGMLLLAMSRQGLQHHGTQAAPLARRRGGLIGDNLEALRYLRRHRRATQVILLMFLFWCCGAIILSGLAGVVVDPNKDAGAMSFGMNVPAKSGEAMGGRADSPSGNVDSPPGKAVPRDEAASGKAGTRDEAFSGKAAARAEDHSRFHKSNGEFSIFLGLVGAGMIAGAASCSIARRGIPKEFGIAFAMMMVGVFFFLFSLPSSYPLAVILLMVAAFFGAVMLVSLDTLLQRIVPDFIRGRVMAVRDMLANVGLVGVAVPLAISSALDLYILTILRVVAVIVLGIGTLLLVYYYRRQSLPLAVSIARRLALFYLSAVKRFDVGNAGRIPSAGPVIFVANHTTPYDPLCLQAASRHRVIQFMMAKEYYEKKPLTWFFKWLKVIPVNRTGNDTASIRAALRALADGGCIGMFPEGGISEDGRLKEGRQGVALLALMSGATVVPAYIQGTSPHSGMIEDFRKFDKVTLWFGAPIRFDDLKKRDDAARAVATERIMGAIRTLRDRHETRPEMREG